MMPDNLRKQWLTVIPDGDDKPRRTCSDCGFIDYQSPHIIVGAICVTDDGKILLARRNIEPRKGYWNIPAGYLERGETVGEGAARETLEETGAEVQIDGLLAVLELPHIGQVHHLYRARIVSMDQKPGFESQEVALFAWEDIPWDELAFPTNHELLHIYKASAGKEIDKPVQKVIPPSANDNRQIHNPPAP